MNSSVNTQVKDEKEPRKCVLVSFLSVFESLDSE